MTGLRHLVEVNRVRAAAGLDREYTSPLGAVRKDLRRLLLQNLGDLYTENGQTISLVLGCI